MSASPSPHERHHASNSPHDRCVSPTSRPRHCRLRTPNSEPKPPLPANLAWWSAPVLRKLRRWMRWGGAGRREGRHWLHTFEEILAQSPSDPDDTEKDVLD